MNLSETAFNEYGPLQCVALRPARQAFVADAKIDAEWNKGVFTKRFGYEADSFGAKSYDAVRIYLQALERAGTDDPEKVRDTLYAFRDYKGALGAWGFAGTGEPELFPEMRRIE